MRSHPNAVSNSDRHANPGADRHANTRTSADADSDSGSIANPNAVTGKRDH